MGFKQWLDNKKKERDEKKRLEQLEEQKRQEEIQQILDILDHFEIPELKSFCKNFIGSEPPEETEVEKDTGRRRIIKPDRKSHIDFILDYYENDQLKLKQLKDYALKHRLLAPSYFGEDSKEAGEQREFDNIRNAIRASFQPENIQNEEHLQSQLTIFLKAKFPEKKVEREVITKNGDKLDIVVDEKFVFELKVPKRRTDLRNLSAQLDEYKNEYQYLCAVIADVSGVDVSIMTVEPRLAQNIKDYVDRYKVKLNVPSLVFPVKIRG